MYECVFVVYIQHVISCRPYYYNSRSLNRSVQQIHIYRVFHYTQAYIYSHQSVIYIATIVLYIQSLQCLHVCMYVCICRTVRTSHSLTTHCHCTYTLRIRWHIGEDARPKRRTLTIREQHRAGFAATRLSDPIHAQSSSPCSKSLRSPCRTTATQHHRTERWPHPSQRRMPSQIPILYDYLQDIHCNYLKNKHTLVLYTFQNKKRI